MKIVYDSQLDILGDEGKTLSTRKSKLFFDRAVRIGHNEVSTGVEADLYRPSSLISVHHPEYVDQVFRGDIPNGYGNKEHKYLLHALASCSTMVAAALWAARSVDPVCAPVQGFHHAGWDYGYGYCTFNGLMLAASALRDSGYVRPIIILDCDGHHGDGTEDILHAVTNLDVRNISYEKKNYSLQKLMDVLRESPPSMVMYQAGADSHEDDPYGAGFLSTAQMRERDLTVFRECKRMGHHLVWNLAGGYATASGVLKLHLQTLEVGQLVWAH